MQTSYESELRAYGDAERQAAMPSQMNVHDDLLYVALRTTMAICRKLNVVMQAQRVFTRKADNTPVTLMDPACEALGKEMFGTAFGNSVTFIGEEGEEKFVEEGLVAAMDPIDGTWGFISDTGGFGVTLTIYENGKPLMGVVAQPSASELTYATGTEPTRLLRAGRWGTQATWDTLPQQTKQERLLINTHLRATDRQYADALFAGWEKDIIKQVRYSGNSPAVCLSEVAKGSTMYTAKWNKPSSPHDLGGPVKIVENAGGKVVDLDGAPIEVIGHEGIFIAGLRNEHIETVRKILLTLK